MYNESMFANQQMLVYQMLCFNVGLLNVAWAYTNMHRMQ